MAVPRKHTGAVPAPNLPDLHVLAEEIADDLQSALEQIESVLADFQQRRMAG